VLQVGPHIVGVYSRSENPFPAMTRHQLPGFFSHGTSEKVQAETGNSIGTVGSNVSSLT
jgi:hypothetical protein